MAVAALSGACLDLPGGSVASAPALAGPRLAQHPENIPKNWEKMFVSLTVLAASDREGAVCGVCGRELAAFGYRCGAP